MGFYDWVGYVGAGSGLFAAILWFIASHIEVPDDKDTLVPALPRMGRERLGSLFACIAVARVVARQRSQTASTQAELPSD